MGNEDEREERGGDVEWKNYREIAKCDEGRQRSGMEEGKKEGN